MDQGTTMNEIKRRHVDDDGYVVAPERQPPERQSKGVKCGKCGFKVAYGATIGYACPHGTCPLGLGPTHAD